jgi:type VI secretion system protein ImpA
MDIAPLLIPVNASHPGGFDVSFSPDIDAIQEMRREDDPSLDQGEWVTAVKTADWARVARSCESILANKSKDLRVAGWLADAWARLRGYEGLADGLNLTAGLLNDYWDQLHPQPDEDDQEQRIGNLRWLATRVEQLVPLVPLVVHGESRLTLLEIATARSKRLADAAGQQAAPQKNANDAPPDSGLTLELVWRDATSGGREAARVRRALVTQSRSALLRLQTVVQERLSDEAPSFVGPREALDAALDELKRLERECHLSDTQDEDRTTERQTVSEPIHTASAGPNMPRMSQRIETRQQALEQLRSVAAFFRDTEPHSPVAYLADKAVRWSKMPLHEWLRTVVKDGASLAHIEDMLGVDKDDPR